MKISSIQLKDIFLDIAEEIEKQKDYLSELDRAIGDGDHGVTMSQGWQAIKEKLSEFAGDSDCGDMCKSIGMAFLNAVGSSVGPLYATAFMRGGIAVQNKTELEDDDIIRFWVSAGNGIKDRGKAQVGDKTMVDMWDPAIKALEDAHKQGQDVLSCLEKAVKAGEAGMKSTADMVSQKGRSSRLGDRSLGHQDPGATSSYIILSTFYESLKKLA